MKPSLAPYIAAAIVASLVTPPAAAAPFAVEEGERKDAGARVLLAPREAHDAVMVVSFAVGAVDDGIQSGLTRLTQHMLIDGNAREPAGRLRQDLYAAAATLDVTTEVRRSTFRLRAPRRSFDALATRLLAALFAPKLEARSLPRCKRLTLNDEMPAAGRDDLLSFLAGSLILAGGGGASGQDFTNHPYGDADVIPRLGFADVEQHVLSKLTPANATIVVTGSFDAAKLERAIQAYQGGVQRPPRRPEALASLPLELERKAPREVYVQAHVIGLERAEQAAAARLLAAILEERLQARLRKKGVSYELDVYVVRREWLDLLVIEVPVGAGRGVGLDTELRALAGGVRDGSFLPGEFERNKRFAVAAMQRDDEVSARLADALLDGGGAPWHSEEVLTALGGLSQAAFLGHARAWLDDKRTVRVTLAPAADDGKAP